MSVKETLESMITSNLVESNKYFDEYCDLILNHSIEKQIPKTQVHHIIPRCVYKQYAIAEDNSENNCINLLHKDHVLAHLFLALCAKESWFYLANAAAVRNTLNNSQYKNLHEYLEDREFFISLDAYQQTQEDWYQYQSERMIGNKLFLGRKHSEETNNKISQKNKGRIYINKDGIVKAVHPEQLDEFISSGWAVGNPNAANATKNGITYCWIHNDVESTKVDVNELDEYLSSGWVRGRLVSSKMREMYKHRDCSGKIFIHRGTEEKHVRPEELDCYLSEGWIQGGAPRPNFKMRNKENLGKSSAGRVHITNGVVNKFVYPDELDAYYAQGFYKGRIVTKKGT